MEKEFEKELLGLVLDLFQDNLKLAFQIKDLNNELEHLKDRVQSLEEEVEELY